MSPELAGWLLIFLTPVTLAAYVHARRTRNPRPVVETTPTAGRATMREWWDREPVNLDRADGVLPRQCWTPGPKGNHGYGSRVGGGWQCMRCGDQATP